MMTSTVFSMCITALFAWWVWSLKQELSATHEPGTLVTGTNGTADQSHATTSTTHVVHHPTHQHAVGVSPASHPEQPPSPKRRRSDGVPVWTIT